MKRWRFSHTRDVGDGSRRQLPAIRTARPRRRKRKRHDQACDSRSGAVCNRRLQGKCEGTSSLGGLAIAVRCGDESCHGTGCRKADPRDVEVVRSGIRRLHARRRPREVRGRRRAEHIDAARRTVEVNADRVVGLMATQAGGTNDRSERAVESRDDRVVRNALVHRAVRLQRVTRSWKRVAHVPCGEASDNDFARGCVHVGNRDSVVPVPAEKGGLKDLL